MSNSFHVPKIINFSVTAPGTGERLPAFYVRDNFSVVITNPRDSEGNFYLGATKAESEAKQKTLIPGQSMAFPIANTAAIWVDADESTDVLEVVLGDAISGSVPA